MANNITVKTADGGTVTMRTVELAPDLHIALFTPAGADGIPGDFLESGQQFMANSMPGALAFEHAPLHDAAAGANPFQMGLEARLTNPTAVGDGDNVRAQADVMGRPTVNLFSVADLWWSRAPAAAEMVSSTADVVLKAAAGAGLRNCLTGFQLAWGSLSGAADLVIKDGSTVLWRVGLPSGAAGVLPPMHFLTPLRGSANTALNAALSASVTGGVYLNAQGIVSR